MARYVVAIEPLASMPPNTVADAVAPALQRYLLGPLGQDDG
jgi:Tetracyclin repressor-like, C-terminal domain